MSRHGLAPIEDFAPQVVRRENAAAVSKGNVTLRAVVSWLQVFLSLLIRYKSEPG